MRRCLQLAKSGQLHAAPNPMVGSVVVHDDRIIGEGYHRKCGEPHAEVNALNAVKDKSLLKKSKLYVNLEPCAHVGRTPACSRMIADAGIPEVIIGCTDSFDKVNGKGIRILEDAGVQVKVGLLEQESRFLNRRFFCFHEKKRPYIILKWAQTQDGYIDFIRKPETPVGPNWITDEFARVAVHKWRASEAAIMVGTNTADKDDPKLNVRHWSGKHPLRLLIDRNLRLPQNLSLLRGDIPTLAFTEQKAESKKNVEYIRLKFDAQLLQNIMRELHNRDILSVIIEGGSYLLNSFIEQNLWDEARVFIGQSHFTEGIKAPVIKQKPEKITRTDAADLLLYFSPDIKSDYLSVN